MSNDNGSIKEQPKEQTKEQLGPTQIDVVVEGDGVILKFRRSVSWVMFTPDQAAAMGQALLHCAKMASGKKLIVVPGHPG